MDGRTLAQKRVGETLAEKYTLDHLLGAGGMGAVYAATNTWTRRRVAIKVLHPALDVDPEYVARFIREAQAASALRHPNIIEVIDLGRDPSGMPFIVQELLDGQDLRHRIEAGGLLSAQEAVAMIVPILGALVCAHDAGIVHRDIKPDNLFLCALPDGSVEPKLIDFGVAKVRSNNDPALTGAGAMVGTPAYMAPEQVTGAASVDARADLWAIGAVLFEALSGRPPFLGATTQEVIILVATQRPPPLRTIAPSVAHDLAVVIDQALEPDREKRTQSAAAMLSALLACREVLSREEEAKLVERHHQSLASFLQHSKQSPDPRAGTGDTVYSPSSHNAPPATRRSAEPEPPIAPLPSDAPVHGRWPWIGAVTAALATIATIATVAVTSLWSRASRPPSLQQAHDAQAPLRIIAAPERDANTTVSPANNALASSPWRALRGASAESAPLLGVDRDAPTSQRGFRPERRVTAPAHAFEIMRREVAWSELDPWLDAHPTQRFERPANVARDAAARAALSATGVPWLVADAYCRSIDARLPNEEEWEWAARGEALRPFPWGSAPIDPSQTNALRGPGAPVQAPGIHRQDCTPDAPDESVCDLLGNAREWTSDLYREDRPGTDERWTQSGTTTYRALRGLSPSAPRTATALQQTASFRVALCATPPCPSGWIEALSDVGFRCARTVASSPATSRSNRASAP